MSFYWKVGLGMAVVLALAFLIIFLLPRGESAIVERQLQEAMEAARRGETERVIGFISKSYGDRPEEYGEVCATIRRYVGPGKYRDLEVSGLEIRVIGESATARFRVRVMGPTGMPDFSRRIDLDLRKEGESWKVISARSDPAR